MSVLQYKQSQVGYVWMLTHFKTKFTSTNHLLFCNRLLQTKCWLASLKFGLHCQN